MKGLLFGILTSRDPPPLFGIARDMLLLYTDRTPPVKSLKKDRNPLKRLEKEKESLEQGQDPPKSLSMPSEGMKLVLKKYSLQRDSP